MKNEYQYAVEATTEPPLEPICFATLDASGIERGPAVIDGILREGAIGTLISSSKARKSWAVAALIAATLTGTTWFGHSVAQGRVLLIDAELTPATILFRLRKVFEALGVGTEVFELLDIFSLRGRTHEGARALRNAASKGAGYYRCIIIDPLSCFYPDQDDVGKPFDENSNVQMRALMNGLIALAEHTRAAVLMVHHASKGAQFDKAVVDVGAGAGAVVRAVDAHLIFRSHQEPDTVVLEGVVRDFPEITPTCWAWSFPTYREAAHLNPEDLAGKQKRTDEEKAAVAAKKAAKTMTVDVFCAKYVTPTPQLLGAIETAAAAQGFAISRVKSMLDRGVAIGKVFKWGGKARNPTRYAIVPEPVHGCEKGVAT